MKKSILIITVLIISCRPTRIDNNDKEDWIFAFKSTVFKNCLCESYGKEFDILLKKDQSLGANFEVLNNVDMKIADSIGKNFAITITSFPENSDFYGKKVTINSCLYFYNSKYLNSIAKAVYNKHLIKQKNMNNTND